MNTLIKLSFIGAMMLSFSVLADVQQQLDAECEAARALKLAPERAELIQNCVANEAKTLAECQHFYRDHGAAVMRQGEVIRAPLYYDLPACQEAFEYRQRYRRAD